VSARNQKMKTTMVICNLKQILCLKENG